MHKQTHRRMYSRSSELLKQVTFPFVSGSAAEGFGAIVFASRASYRKSFALSLFPIHTQTTIFGAQRSFQESSPIISIVGQGP